MYSPVQSTCTDNTLLNEDTSNIIMYNFTPDTETFKDKENGASGTNYPYTQVYTCTSLYSTAGVVHCN